MDSSVSSKDEIWFLRVCHHISTGLCFTVHCSMIEPWMIEMFVVFRLYTHQLLVVTDFLYFRNVKPARVSRVVADVQALRGEGGNV